MNLLSTWPSRRRSESRSGVSRIWVEGAWRGRLVKDGSTRGFKSGPRLVFLLSMGLARYLSLLNFASWKAASNTSLILLIWCQGRFFTGFTCGLCSENSSRSSSLFCANLRMAQESIWSRLNPASTCFLAIRPQVTIFKGFRYRRFS